MLEPAALTRIGFRSAGWTLAVLFAIDLVVFIDRNALAATLVPIQERFALRDSAAGLLLTIFTVSFCATLPIVGWLSDRMPRKYLLAAGLGIWSFTTLGTGLAETYEQLLLARALTGIGEATCAPIGPTLLADGFPKSQRSRALAILFMAIPFGSGLGLALGAQATAWLDWRWAFYVTGVLGAAAACLALTIDEPRPGSHDPPETDALSGLQFGSLVWRDWASLLYHRSFVLTTLGMAFMVFGLIALNYWAPSFLTNVKGVPLADAGTWLGILVGVTDRKSTRLNSSHIQKSRMPSSA